MNHGPDLCVYFFVVAIGPAPGDIGREKFLSGLVGESESPSVSATFISCDPSRVLTGAGTLARPTLPPLVPRCIVGDMTRCGGSTLAALLCMLAGRAGTGGASGGPGTCAVVPFVRPGDGLLNVRSVMDPPLLVRCRPPRVTPPRFPVPLPLEDADPRRTIRFVCISPTCSGVVVCDRRAAAAAAEEREALEVVLWRKACAAAVAAFEEVLRSTGCFS